MFSSLEMQADALPDALASTEKIPADYRRYRMDLELPGA
jgi:hypothetical protein